MFWSRNIQSKLLCFSTRKLSQLLYVLCSQKFPCLLQAVPGFQRQ